MSSLPSPLKSPATWLVQPEFVPKSAQRPVEKPLPVDIATHQAAEKPLPVKKASLAAQQSHPANAGRDGPR